MLTMKMLRTTDADFDRAFQKILAGKENSAADAESIVRLILQEVKKRGDAALFEYTECYDRITINKHSIKLTTDEIEHAYTSLPLEDRASLSLAADRIASFHRLQYNSLLREMAHGDNVGEVIRPLQRVGLYVPGGKASYPSTVLMTAIPAKVAGVQEIIMVTPGQSLPVLAAAYISGVDQIYRVGGAQAIAAMAYGTESIARVDKIVGPGNRYVETAKRLLFGVVGIDMLAGPSEVLILADNSAIPSYAAADLIAQAEHDEDAVAIMIATSEQLLYEVEHELRSQLKDAARRDIAVRALERQGCLIYTPAIEHACTLANKIAPEHLELMVSLPRETLKHITTAGAVFLGNYSPTAIGDYVAGPSHVLPTSGTARFFSPLGVADFIRHMSIIDLSKSEFSRLASSAMSLARMEGLEGHATAVQKRMMQ